MYTAFPSRPIPMLIASIHSAGAGGDHVTLKMQSGASSLEMPFETKLPLNAERDYRVRPTIAGQTLNEILLDLDDLPEILKRDDSKSDEMQSVTVPAVLNGRITKPGVVDQWQFNAVKGEKLRLEMRAIRLGSPLQAVLTLTDKKGKQLARVESTAKDADPSFEFVAPEEGSYKVQVSERFRTRGGPAFSYRLRVARPDSPDFRLRLVTDAVNLPRGGQAKLKVHAERLGGFNGPITLAFDDLPSGIKIAPAAIASGQSNVEITLSTETAAKITVHRMTIRGLAMIGDKSESRTATLAAPRGQPETGSVLVAVTIPVPFKVVADYEMGMGPCGTVVKRHYRIERGSYAGELEVRLADRQARHLQGASGPTLKVGADAKEFEYPFTLPPWMERGRTCRVCIMTIATIRDGDTDHQVSYSAITPNDQLITVVETSRLSIETEKNSVLVSPGGMVVLPVRIARSKGLVGDVKVELILASHIRGVKARPLIIPADRSRGQLAIQFDSKSVGPFNRPAILRRL